MVRGGRMVVAAAVAALVAGAACGESRDADPGAAGQESGRGSLTIYSGRSEELVGPLIERFERSSGIDVAVRYGDTSEMAATILDEGDRSRADVFFSQDAGALGAVSREGRLQKLDDEILERVKEPFRSPEGEWIGVTGRARVVAFNTDALRPEDLPDSIVGFTDPKWKGKIGWAPTNGSFQAFITGFRVLEGEEEARRWLEGIKANNPRTYEKNSAIVEAVSSGEVQVGFVNHYYALQLQSKGSAMKAANKYYGSGDPGALVNVAGVGIVKTTGHQKEAEQFIEYLLSVDAQRYFVEQVFELPMVEGVAPPAGVPAAAALEQPTLDLSKLEDLKGTTELLQQVGV